MVAELGVFVCEEVFRGTKPILLVAHEPDGSWSFVCGGVHPDDPSSYHLVGWAHLLARDSSLEKLADLPAGYAAERSGEDAQWVTGRIEDA